MEKMKAIIEALIFASDTSLSLEKIRAVFPDLEKKEIQEMIGQLISEYEARQGGISIQEVAGGFQFRTHPELGQWIRKLKSQKPPSFSPASLETLAIIAYKQPIVKSEIESIRGVDVGGPLKNLLEKKLIRIIGRKDVPGKPIIYGTTKKFLEVFNLKDLMDLPNLREFKELNRQQEIPMEDSSASDEGNLFSLEEAARQNIAEDTGQTRETDNQPVVQEASRQEEKDDPSKNDLTNDSEI